MVEEREPRAELIRDQSLLPPQRWAADYAGDPAFRRSPGQQAAFERLVDSAEVLYGAPDADAAALRRTVLANPSLRWVQLMAAGGGALVRAADLPSASLHSVRFTTTAGVHAGPLAEFALLGLLAGAKGLPRLQRDQAAHHWAGRWPMGQLREQRIAVLGMGQIGREVARLCAALGADVVGVARREMPGAQVSRTVHPDGLAGVVAEADALVVTLPGTDLTHHMVDATVLRAARPGLTVVSVGRGTVIEEGALVRALASGRVGYAALDVVEEEPLAVDSPLWDMPNVLISPHTAANSPHEERLVAELFAENLTRYVDGLPLRNVVNTDEFY